MIVDPLSLAPGVQPHRLANFVRLEPVFDHSGAKSATLAAIEHHTKREKGDYRQGEHGNHHHLCITEREKRQRC